MNVNNSNKFEPRYKDSTEDSDFIQSEVLVGETNMNDTVLEILR